jgi:phenylacetate-CoA ligase
VSVLAKVSDQIERVALQIAPAGTARVLAALPPSFIVALQRAHFTQTLKQAAAGSPFYREQFRLRNIDVSRIVHPSQLGDFYTTGEDLRREGPEAFLIGHPDTAFETTGTTSPVPKRVFFSNRELDQMGRAAAAALYILGLRREDIVVSAFDCSFWVSPAILRLAVRSLGCFHVEAGKIEPLEFYTRAIRYRPTVIFGEPSWIWRLSEIAGERGTWPVKFIVAGGENASETSRRAVERIWAAPLYLNYGQTEAFGALGLECRIQQGYHRNDLHFVFEIAEPDTNGEGELVYTTLTRNVMPLIRYRSADITRLIDEPCPCGLFARRVAKIRTRIDEQVVCGMGNIAPWVFAEIQERVPGFGDDWQVLVSHNGRCDVVELRVEADGLDGRAGIADIPDINVAVLGALRVAFPDFWKNLEMKLYELRLTVLPPGSLRQGGRKLRRIIDQRDHRDQR